MSETLHVDFDGHRVAYRVAGEGPALVVLHLYRRREDIIQLRLLSDRWQVFEVAPLGEGRSDRVAGYESELPEQVLAVLDSHGVDRFVVWGYSRGGAIAALIARGTPRAAGLVCGALSVFDFPSDSLMRRMERRPASDSDLWRLVKSHDWIEEIKAMRQPSLFYWGSEDRRMVKGLRRAREELTGHGVDFVEFEGVGHEVGGDEVLLADLVIPAVVDWAQRRLGPSW